MADMCGIAGVWQRDGQPVDPLLLDRMNGALRHRGPDGEGAWRNGAIGFTHRRLRVIDLSPAADQPMVTADGRLVVSFNGEIHNYLELRKALVAHGVAFRTHTDTEVLLQAVRAWGTGAFARFNGMWAAALWDAEERRLIFCRDRFGIKPLYFLECGPTVAFASEAKALLAAFPEARCADQDEVYRFLAGASPDQAPASFFAGIRLLEPGFVRVFTAKGERPPLRYWTFTPPAPTPRRDAEAHFRERFTDAVRLRLRSDVPVGVCLSGGLDSSAVARTAVALLDRPLHCFCLRLPGHPLDESRYAAAVADDPERYRLHWVDAPAEPFLDPLRRIVWHHDAPTPSRGRYPQWFVMEAAAREVTVLLDGQGGDELLAGYDRFVVPCLLDHFTHTRPRALAAALRGLPGIMKGGWRGLAPLSAAALLRRLGREPLSARRIMSPAFAAAHGPAPAACFFNSWACRGAHGYGSHLTTALWLEFTRTGLPELLHAEDALGMAFSLESRTPFLDHRLVEFCFSLPDDEKIRGGWTKSLLRRALADRLPPLVRERRDKIGFETPLAQWMGRPANRRALRDLLLDPAVARRGILDQGHLEKLLAGGADGRISGYPAAEALWRATSLELWFEQFIDSPRPPAPAGTVCPGADNSRS